MLLVLTADQRGSRRATDLVPALLATLSEVSTVLPFQRTAGDEVQAVLDDPDALPRVLEPLLRSGEWTVGVGVGTIETPLPAEAREGRGPAYVHARTAVTAAKQAPWPVRVVGDDRYGAEHLESAVWLWASVLSRRTEKGWQVADLVDQGLSYERVAARLGITQSAVSQRARAAGLAEGARARGLVAHLAAECLRSR